MKVCSHCKQEKDLSAFWKDKSTSDGKRYQCIDCSKAWTKIWRKQNQSKINKYDARWKLNHPEVKAAYRSRKNELGKKRHKQTSASASVYRASMSGKLEATPCIVCDSIDVRAHHWNYEKQLDVVWFCPQHHTRWHKLKKDLATYASLMLDKRG